MPPAKRIARPRSRSASAGPAAGRARSRSVGAIVPMDIAGGGSRKTALNQLMAAWKAEVHETNTGFAPGNILAAGLIAPLNIIVQNDEQSGRDGCRIGLNRLSMTYNLQSGGTVAAPKINRVRCVVLWDKQTNGVAPVLANIQETGVAGTETICAIPNFNFRQRLVVLYDQMHILNSVASPTLTRSLSIDLTGKMTTYVAGAGAGAVADIITGGLFFVWYSDAGAAGDTVGMFNASLYFHP